MTKLETTSRVILIGGVARSGTSLTRQFLGRHREIAAFGETQLIRDWIFFHFPEWIHNCLPEYRTRLLDIYKHLCLTRFFRFRAWWKVSDSSKTTWQFFDEIWGRRFRHPQRLRWRNPLWAVFEKAWLLEGVQGRIFGQQIPDDRQAQIDEGLRGLFCFFSQRDIQQHFAILDPLEDAVTLDQVYRIYGNFWNAVFSTYARKQDKRYWAEKTPDNTLHALFFDRCFSDLKMINLVRDGRDVACSNVERPWGQKNLQAAIDDWAVRMTKILKAQENLPQSCYINIRYEDLILDTRATLQRLTHFLEVDFDEAMLSQDIHSSSVGRYQDIWPQEMEAYVRERHAALFRQFDYSV